MNSGTITDQLLDAVELIVDKAVSQAGYDKTVQAVVSKCVTASTGKYSVKYQGGSFYAYAQNPEIVYSPNTQVYVLIPENDMSKRKTILGTVDRLGTNYKAEEEKYYYAPVGNNICINNETEHGLCSYNSSDLIVLYNNGEKYENFEIDIQGAEFYLKNSNYITIGATFKTNLTTQHQAKGNYGVRFVLTFEDVLSGREIDREYVVDINSMKGNPYNFIIPSKQSATFEIDNENFKEIKKIELFSQDFTPTESGHLDDIFISNIELQGVNLMKIDESSGYSVAIHAKQGSYFETTKLGEDENKITKELEAIVYKDRIVAPKTDDITYYWFKENSSIYYNSEKYLKLGGQGWEYLNSDLEKGQSIYTVIKANVKSRETKFKCVVVYNGNLAIASNEITIYNLASNYEVKIESSAGTATKENETTLTCKVTGVAEGQDISYNWSKKIDSNLNYEPLDWTAASNVADLTEAIQMVSYKCTATENVNSEILGTAIINIVRRDETEDDNVTFAKVELINGVQIFKYDENGVSPESHNYSNTSIILPISFKFYNSDGIEITPAEIGASNIIWRVPTEETMIKTSEVVGTYGEQLNFTIRNNFDRKRTNNTIELEVHYNNKIIKTNTNLIFMKEGDIGSNGTKYTCLLSANPVSGNIPERIVYTKAGEKGSLNYQYNSKPFKVMLFENGDLIYDDTSANNIAENVIVKYSIDKRIYDDTHIDATNFAINEDGTGFMYITIDEEDSLKDNPSNILKCEVTYNENTYYATLPISLITMNNEGTIYIKEGTVFNTVVYDNSGRNPKYDSNNPFELLVYDSMGNEISQKDYVSYDWSVKGGYYLSEWHSVQNLEIKNWALQKNQINFRAVDSLLGYNVNNAIYCKVFINESLLAEIRIPIEMYLNRYWSIVGNTWDGNTINLDDSNGAILAPQVGAVKKEEDNSFTGVFMGSVAKEGQDDIQTGLYGYKSGVQTVAISAENGTAIFGNERYGQLVISPTRENIEIKSNNYKESEYDDQGHLISEGSGLKIDLSNASIEYGNGNFRVTGEGTVYAKGYSTEEYVKINAVDKIVLEYCLLESNLTPTDVSEWTEQKPVWKEEFSSYALWNRLKTTYKDGNVITSTPQRDTSWDKIREIGNDLSETSQKINAITTDDGSDISIRNGSIFVTKQNSDRLVLDNNGIGFQKWSFIPTEDTIFISDKIYYTENKVEYTGIRTGNPKEQGLYQYDWGDTTSVWALDGTFDAQGITVKNLSANSIINGTLKVVDDKDTTEEEGRVQVYDTDNNLIIDLCGKQNEGISVTDVNGALKTQITPNEGLKGYNAKDNNRVIYKQEEDRLKMYRAEIEDYLDLETVLIKTVNDNTRTGIAFIPKL